MSNVQEQLAAQGWRLSPEGIEIVTEKGACKDFKSVLSSCQNTDLKDIGANCLSSQLSNKKVDNLVVQIQKLRNIGAPKANEDSQAAPRLLKLIITDGHTHCQALETEPLNFLSLHKTAPGTKLLLRSAQIISGYIILNPASCKLVGGQVPSLYEKWELNKNISNHKRGNAEGEGPPPWVNFGKKLINVQDTDFKSLEVKVKTEQSDFEQQRQGLIAEVSTGAVKKVFGGGTKPIRDVKSASFNNRPDIRGRKGGRREFKENVEMEKGAQKPSEKISLFDFLETKLPTGVENEIGDDMEKNGTTGDSKKSNFDNYRGNYNDNRKNFGGHQYQNPKQINNFGGPNFKSYDTKNKDYGNKSFGNEGYGKGYRDNKLNESYNYSKGNKEIIKSNDSYTKAKTGDKNEHLTKVDNYNSKGGGRNKPPAGDASYNKFDNTKSNKNLDGLSKNMDRLNINASFVSKSFKQHLNLGGNDFGGPKANNDLFGGPRNANNTGFGGPKSDGRYAGPKVDNHEVFGGPKMSNNVGGPRVQNSDEFGGPKSGWKWSVGDSCLAKYWEDNKYYNATVVGLTNKTCVVQFNDYGNMEEVLQRDCLPITDEKTEAPLTHQRQQRREYTGSYEYRRGGNKRF